MNIEHEALMEALDQYVANQSEYEDCSLENESPKLQAARRMLDKLLAPIIALADNPTDAELYALGHSAPLPTDPELRAILATQVLRRRVLSPCPYCTESGSAVTRCRNCHGTGQL